MPPKEAINSAIELAKGAIAQGGKPSSIKLKVKFDKSKKVQHLKHRANAISKLSDSNGVTR